MTQSMCLPAAWVDRIMARISAIYGAQKCGSMYAAVDRDELAEVWGRTLARFDGAIIGAALQSLASAGGEWPPTLPEFAALCREQVRRQEHKLALPGPRSDEQITEGHEQVSRLMRESDRPPDDPLRWARNPKSQAAVMMLRLGARSDRRLRAILEQHLGEVAKNHEHV